MPAADNKVIRNRQIGRQANRQTRSIADDVQSTANLMSAIALAPIGGPEFVITVTQDFNLTDEIVVTAGMNIVIRSGGSGKRTLTRTNNAARFTCTGDPSYDSIIKLQNIIIEAGGDGVGGSIEGILIQIDETVDFILEDTSIINGDAITIELIRVNHKSHLTMTGNSMIEHCFLSASDLITGAMAYVGYNSTFTMKDNSTISNISGNWSGNINRPSVVMAIENSVVTMLNESKCTLARTFYGITLFSNSQFHIDNYAELCYNECLGILVLANNIPAIATTVRITGGRIHNNTKGASIRLNNRNKLEMTAGSIDHNISEPGIFATGIIIPGVYSIANISGGSISYNNNFNNASAVSAWPQAANSRIEITGGKFIGNTSINGGAIGAEASTGVLTIAGSDPLKPVLLEDNTATGDGGAVYVDNYNMLTLGPNVHFVNNKASRYKYDDTTPPMTLAGVRGAYDDSGMTFTQPFPNAFSNADVNVTFSPGDEVAPRVVFDTQGGGDDPPEQIVDPTGSALVIKPITTPYKAGLVFDGWFTEPVGGIRWSFGTMNAASYLASLPPTAYVLTLSAHYREYTKRERCKHRWTHGRWIPRPNV